MTGTEAMRRCLHLARLGAGSVAPNPLVGAVLVQGDRVLAEGWHRRFGGAHAEVECLRAFGNGPVPADAVLFVSLEPCVHHGKTPPCTDLLIARGVRKVVVGCTDPDPRVAGRGIERLREAGIEVTTGMLEAECRWTNRRFITSIERQRPYILLKWARSVDGFIDRHPRTERRVQRISSDTTDVLVHRWRSEEQAILVGSRTGLHDDPRLTVRHVAGRHPLRVVIDRKGITPARSQVYNGAAPTLLITAVDRPDVPVEQCLIAEHADLLKTVLSELHRRGVRSVLVEGGSELLGHFIQQGLWDEARVITGTVAFGQGAPAPSFPALPLRSFVSGSDRIHLYAHTSAPDPAWPW